MTELEKALNGEDFNSRDPEIQQFQNQVKEMWHEYNHLSPNDPKKKEILKELVTGYNDYVFIEPQLNVYLEKYSF